MSRGVNLSRRQDLEAAFKRAKPKDEITLEGLTKLWGTSKQNFVNTMRAIEKLFDIPDPRPGPRGIHVYPAKKTIGVLLAYEKRNDAAEKELAARQARILGRGTTGKRKKAAQPDLTLSLSDMVKASRVMAETEERERAQRMYIPVEEVKATSGRVFSMISSFMSDLDANVDPNGLLPQNVRDLIRTGARNALMEFHAEMKHMLTGDAPSNATGSSRRRSAAGRSGRTQARRSR